MDIVFFDKSKFGIGNGFDRRTLNAQPKSLLIHSTNGAKGTTYESERNFLYRSPKVSASYLVGKQLNQITKFLDDQYRAWHAGAVNNSIFNNNNSTGIECHYTPGEGLWTSAMHENLTFIVKILIARYNITSPLFIERHRTVAIPKGRKIDPSGFNDFEFEIWRASLFEKPKPKAITYKVIGRQGANIRTSPRQSKTNIVGTLDFGDVFESEALKTDELGIYVHGINTYAHLTRGKSRGKKLDGLGFVHTSNLTIVG